MKDKSNKIQNYQNVNDGPKTTLEPTFSPHSPFKNKTKLRAYVHL